MLCSASLFCCLDHSTRDLLYTDLQEWESFGFSHTTLKKEDLRSDALHTRAAEVHGMARHRLRPGRSGVNGGHGRCSSFSLLPAAGGDRHPVAATGSGSLCTEWATEIRLCVTSDQLQS